MLDDATRARLDEGARGDAPVVYLRMEDFHALLAAYDAQAARLATLEPCYADAQATAARLLIEREQYDQTVRNAEERAQFAVERADAAEAERDRVRAELDEHRIAYTALCGERDQLDGQIDRLANFIMQEIPGEPSQSQGAVDTAIRLLERATRLAALEQAARAWARVAADVDVAILADATARIDFAPLRQAERVLSDAVARLDAPPGEATDA